MPMNVFSLLVAGCYALSFHITPVEPLFIRNVPIIELSPVMNDAVTWNSDTNPGHLASQAATLDPVAVSTLNVPQAHLTRTTARLTIPAGEHWQTAMVNESLIIMLEAGELRVSMGTGQARIARASQANLGDPTLDEITPGKEAILRSGDRLVFHGDGALRMHSADVLTVATIIRVGMPATP